MAFVLVLPNLITNTQININFYISFHILLYSLWEILTLVGVKLCRLRIFESQQSLSNVNYLRQLW